MNSFGAVLAALTLMLPGCAPADKRALRVPSVAGLTEGRAVKLLGSSGLVANVRFEGPRTPSGAVVASLPAAGSSVRPGSVVLLRLEPPKRLPPPWSERTRRAVHRLSRLVAQHPGAFVGIYVDVANRAHVVFGRGAEPRRWQAHLRAAAAGQSYAVETCPRTHRRLRAVQLEIAAKHWTRRKALAFAVGVDPATCTTRVESDLLTRREIETLAERYGTAISVDTTRGSHPVLLPGSSA